MTETQQLLDNEWCLYGALKSAKGAKQLYDAVVDKPNSCNFKILSSTAVGRYLMVEVGYRGCTGFNRKQILVFKNISVGALMLGQSLDPEFSEKVGYSPIAKFVPTQEGRQMALAFIDTMHLYYL